MLERILNAPWWQLSQFLSRGNPPIITQIMGLNTIFFILFIVRRMRGAAALRRDTAIMVQVLLVISNSLVLFQEQILAGLKHII